MGTNNRHPTPDVFDRGLRRARPVTCCLECRRRKVKCDRSNPCGQCQSLSKPCVFANPDSVTSKSRSRRNARPIEPLLTKPCGIRNVGSDGLRKSPDSVALKPAAPSIVPKASEDPPSRTVNIPFFPNGEYNYENEASEIDWMLRLGKLSISESIVRLFRPYLVDKLTKAIGTSSINRSENFHVGAPGSDRVSWHKPNILGSSSELLFPEVAWNFQSSLLPSENQSKILFRQYFLAVDPLAHILHKPSFRYYENCIQRGDHISEQDTALIASVCFAAAVSMVPLQVETQFGVSKQTLVDRLMAIAETALKAAKFMTTSRIKVLQAFTIYLIPQCRGDISRSHSVLVGALVTLAQCIGIHRASPGPGKYYLATHMQQLLWYQILFLQIRTGEAQGPLPRERYDQVPIPMNINDAEMQNPLIPSEYWTDATFTIIRYECYEVHRMIFIGREAVDNNEMTLDDLLEKVTLRRDAVLQKYGPILDERVPIQQCARTVMTLLLGRCDIQLVHGRLHLISDSNFRTMTKIRLDNSCLTVLESAALLETCPALTTWSWYASAYQQYHTVIYLLLELRENPDTPQADRISMILDHVFGVSYGQTRAERVLDLLCLLRDSLAGHFKSRNVEASDYITSTTNKKSPRNISPMDHNIPYEENKQSSDI